MDNKEIDEKGIDSDENEPQLIALSRSKTTQKKIKAAKAPHVAGTAYCVKCKSKQKMVNGVESKTANNRTMMKGNCEKCNTKVNCFQCKKVE